MYVEWMYEGYLLCVMDMFVVVVYEEEEEEVVVVDMNDRDKRERVIQRNKRGGECTARKVKEGKKEVKRRGAGVWTESEREREKCSNDSQQQQATAATSRQ